MDTLRLSGFEEIIVDKQDCDFKIPVMHIELCILIRYFMNNSGVGYCSLLINNAAGKGIKGMIEAAAAKAYIGRKIFVFLSELDNGKKLLTLPALFEKDPSFDGKADLNNFILNTYYHADFKRSPAEIYEEHMKALKDKKVSKDNNNLRKSILELPKTSIELLKHYI